MRFKAAKKYIPLQTAFEVTYRCNLKCKHCFVVRNKNKNELSFREITPIIDQLAQAGCFKLILTGGEIFIRRDILDIAEYVRYRNFFLILFTNGTLLTERIADRLVYLKPNTEISLYGFKATHDRITRVPGSFDATVRGIKLLVDRGLRVTVKSVVMNENVKELWDLKHFAKNLGVKDVLIPGGLLISPRDDGSKLPLALRLSDAQLKDYFRKECFFKKSSGINIKSKLEKVKKDYLLCLAGFVTSNITPYGNVNPCLQIRLKSDTNNLRQYSFKKIWEENKEIRAVRELRVTDRKDCIGCEVIEDCLLCPGIVLLEKGSLVAKLEEACRQTRIKKEIYEKACD